MFDSLAHAYHEKAPEFTAGMGLAAALHPTLDQVTHVLGLVALVVGIYGSIARERRDRLVFAAKLQAARTPVP